MHFDIVLFGFLYDAKSELCLFQKFNKDRAVFLLKGEIQKIRT